LCFLLPRKDHHQPSATPVGWQGADGGGRILLERGERGWRGGPRPPRWRLAVLGRLGMCLVLGGLATIKGEEQMREEEREVW